jgi:hypothetical protein
MISEQERFIRAVSHIGDLVFNDYIDPDKEAERVFVNARPHLQIFRKDGGGPRDYDEPEYYAGDRRLRPIVRGRDIKLRDLVIEDVPEPGYAARVYGVVLGGAAISGQTRYEGVLLGRNTVAKIATKYGHPNIYGIPEDE